MESVNRESGLLGTRLASQELITTVIDGCDSFSIRVHIVTGSLLFLPSGNTPDTALAVGLSTGLARLFRFLLIV